MFVVFVRIQVSEVSLYWSNVLQASAKKKKRKVFNKRDREKCMISPLTFYFVADHSLVRSWSNNRKKSNERESGGLRVVTSLFCAPASLSLSLSVNKNCRLRKINRVELIDTRLFTAFKFPPKNLLFLKSRLILCCVNFVSMRTVK